MMKKGSTLELFSTLSPEIPWIRSGVVERQLSATVWQPRRMILTATEILFVQTDSDVVVDRLPLSSVVFAGQVNLANSTEQDQTKSSWMAQASMKNVKRRGSVADLLAGGPPAANGDSASTASEEQPGSVAAASAGGPFAFEIRMETTAADARTRSYFARVATAEDRDAWVAAVVDAVRAVRSTDPTRGFMSWGQVHPSASPTPSPMGGGGTSLSLRPSFTSSFLSSFPPFPHPSSLPSLSLPAHLPPPYSPSPSPTGRRKSCEGAGAPAPAANKRRSA